CGSHKGSGITDIKASEPANYSAVRLFYEAAAGSAAVAAPGAFSTTAGPASARKANPTRMNKSPSPAANAAIPNAMTDVNSEARKNEPFITVSRVGSSPSNSA